MNEKTETQENESVSPETQAILDELRAEGHEIGDKKPEEQEAPTPKEEPKEETHEEPEEETVLSQEEHGINRVSKEPSLMPAWEHKVAQKQWEKEREQLTQELEALRANPSQANREAVRETAGNLKDLARQYGLELDDNQERFFSDLLAKAVPQDLTQKLTALEQDRQIAFLETQYDAEWSKEVEPLLKSQFGEVPADKLAEIKQSLHNLAFSETYAKVPLKKVFLAEQGMFNLGHTHAKQTVDASKSGKARSMHIDYERVTESDFEKMAPEEAEKYTEWLIAKEGGRKWR
jgi:small-conductance mechanosensitive channel